MNGLWRIENGSIPPEYWSNEDGWTSLAFSTGFSAGERETVRLPLGGRWVFDEDED
jgi:hypothetical protein